MFFILFGKFPGYGYVLWALWLMGLMACLIGFQSSYDLAWLICI